MIRLYQQRGIHGQNTVTEWSCNSMLANSTNCTFLCIRIATPVFTVKVRMVHLCKASSMKFGLVFADGSLVNTLCQSLFYFVKSVWFIFTRSFSPCTFQPTNLVSALPMLAEAISRAFQIMWPLNPFDMSPAALKRLRQPEHPALLAPLLLLVKEKEWGWGRVIPEHTNTLYMGVIVGMDHSPLAQSQPLCVSLTSWIYSIILLAEIKIIITAPMRLDGVISATPKPSIHCTFVYEQSWLK